MKKFYIALCISFPILAMLNEDEHVYDSRAVERYSARQQEVYKLIEHRIRCKQSLDAPMGEHDLPPLHYCVMDDKHIELTRTLLAAGANPSHIDDSGKSPLIRAADNGAIESMRALLATKKCNINQPEIAFNRQTALHLMCRPWHDACSPKQCPLKRTEGIRLLLAHGAHTNMKNCCGQSPLYDLITADYLHNTQEFNKSLTAEQRSLFLQQRKDSIKLLVEYGTRIWLTDCELKTAMLIAMQSKNPYLLELAQFAQRSYARWHLLCGKKLLQREAPLSWLANLHKDLINQIAIQSVMNEKELQAHYEAQINATKKQ